MAESQPSHEEDRHGRRNRWLWIGVGVGLVLALFILQNTQSVQVDFIFAETETPLFWALILATALGAIVGWLLARFRRRNG